MFKNVSIHNMFVYFLGMLGTSLLPIKLFPLWCKIKEFATLQLSPLAIMYEQGLKLKQPKVIFFGTVHAIYS